MKPHTIQVQVDIPTNLPAPTAVNFFNFTVSGPEVQMLAGFLDLRKLIPGAAKNGRVQVEVSDRMFMSMQGFLTLRASVLDLERQLRKQGIEIPNVEEIG